jgi:hypothetical protein
MSEHDALRQNSALADERKTGTDREHGERILAAVEASARAAEKSHPLVEAIARAYQEREDKQE